MRSDIVIRAARIPDDIPAARRLLEEYAASLDVDLSFQNFAQELAALPGDYAAPDGCLLLADDATRTIGCVALRALVRNGARPVGEVKRLYVCGEGRGRGVGRALAEAVIARAQALDYCELKLDTLANMVEARALYAALGFRECAPYYANPLPGVAYMALALR